MSEGRCSNCVYYCKPNTECEPSTKSFEYHLYNQAASAEDKKLRQPKARKRPNRKPPGYGLRPNGPAKLLPPELINEPLKYLQPTPRYAKENEEKQAAKLQHEDDTIRDADGASSVAGAMPGSSVEGRSNFSSGFSCPVPMQMPIPATAPPSYKSGPYNMSDHHSTPFPSNTQGPSYRTGPSCSTSPSHMPGLAYPQVLSPAPGASSTYTASSTPSPYYALSGQNVSSGVPFQYDAVIPRGGSSFGNKNGPYSNSPPAMPVYNGHPYMASQNVQYQWRRAEIAAQGAAPVASPLPATPAPSTAATQSHDCYPQEPSVHPSKRLKASLEAGNSEARWAQQLLPQQSPSAPSEEPLAQNNLLKRRLSQVDLGAGKMKEEEPSRATMQKAEPSEDVDVKIETEELCD
ncbi:hypothetical protein CKM354_000230300 [Cercospora kikuchii]|uniref:Uncharacterized protein n=1 Tax=Cercospora kikuchii TaxID=84275 RepID=A0A9P3C7D1_9PEZI|nr:uncharacterized protein CKM354_000230300 [Cercospora kikuchii]GIZ38904.1 hypothetical protein CKM354_000230300 [Cercospora kikuchii]